MKTSHSLALLFYTAFACPLNAADAPADALNTDAAADLAKKLSNPVAALISVPLQNNVDFGAGPRGDGLQYKLNFRPVGPFSLSEEWNLISRTIVPYVYQKDIIGNSSQSGLSDTTQSLFLSPKEPTAGGWIWGAGPVLLFPTATDDLLGVEKCGIGPTAVVLKQEGGWTYGALANHLWSFAGEEARADVKATFLQPFLSFTTKQQTTFALNTETTYDWENSQWTVPLNLSVSQLVKLGGSLPSSPWAPGILPRNRRTVPSGACDSQLLCCSPNNINQSVPRPCL